MAKFAPLQDLAIIELSMNYHSPNIYYVPGAAEGF